MKSPQASFLIALVALLFLALPSCVMPGDFDRMEQIVLQGQADRADLKVKLERSEITAEQAKEAAKEIDAKVERETAALTAEVRERTTATLEAAKQAATDPWGLVIGGAASIAASIFGTNAMRNRSRKVEIAKLEKSIGETDKWVEEIETKGAQAVNP